MKQRTSGTTVWEELVAKERWSEADARVVVDAWRHFYDASRGAKLMALDGLPD